MALDETIALVSLSDAKYYIGITSTTEDVIIEEIINGVSSAFNSYTQRKLAVTDYDIYLDGNKKPILFLPAWPIISVSSVIEDGTTLTEDDDFKVYYDLGFLYRVDDNWSEGKKNIRVQFAAGYDCLGTSPTLPHDIKLACLKQVAFEYKKYKNKDWGEQSRTYPDGSITKSTNSNLLPEVEWVLDKYKRIVI